MYMYNLMNMHVNLQEETDMSVLFLMYNNKLHI